MKPSYGDIFYVFEIISGNCQISFVFQLEPLFPSYMEKVMSHSKETLMKIILSGFSSIHR